MLWCPHSHSCGIYIKNTEKKILNFPKKLVLSKKIIFNNHGKYVVLCFGKIFENKFSSLKNQHTVDEA